MASSQIVIKSGGLEKENHSEAQESNIRIRRKGNFSRSSSQYRMA
jgi:hypothetical protein